MINKLEYLLSRCCSFFLIAAMLVLSFGLANGQSVYLSNVTGAIGLADTLRTNVPIVWTLNIKVVDTLKACNNGFRLYSPDGATWAIPVIDTVPGADWRRWGGPIYFYTMHPA